MMLRIRKATDGIILFSCFSFILFIAYLFVDFRTHTLIEHFDNVLNGSRRLCEKDETPLETQDGFNVCLGHRNIFFVETSGRGSLNHRQACAVESAARHNPSLAVTVLMTFAKEAVLSDLSKDLATAHGVRTLRIDYEAMLIGTPLWYWYKLEQWKTSQFQMWHLSNALRLILVWRHGGIYLDLDVVVFRPLDLLANCTASEEGTGATNMFLSFSRGHPFLKKCIADMSVTYNPKIFAANGPVAITRNYKEFCGVTKVTMDTSASCGVRVLPVAFACPIPYWHWKEYFEVGSNSTMDFSKSYMIHVWNKMSSKRKLEIGGGSLYDKAMKTNCPITYKYAQQLGSV